MLKISCFNIRYNIVHNTSLSKLSKRVLRIRIGRVFLFINEVLVQLIYPVHFTRKRHLLTLCVGVFSFSYWNYPLTSFHPSTRSLHVEINLLRHKTANKPTPLTDRTRRSLRSSVKSCIVLRGRYVQTGVALLPSSQFVSAILLFTTGHWRLLCN